MTIEQAIQRLIPLEAKEKEIATNLQRLNPKELTVCDEFWSLDRPFVATKESTKYIWENLKHNKNTVQAFVNIIIIPCLGIKHFRTVYGIVEMIDNIEDMVCPECQFTLDNNNIWLIGDLPAICAINTLKSIVQKESKVI